MKKIVRLRKATKFRRENSICKLRVKKNVHHLGTDTIHSYASLATYFYRVHLKIPDYKSHLK